MGFPRQEHWSGLPFPPPGDLPNPEIEPESPALQVDSLPLSHWGNPYEWDHHPYKRYIYILVMFAPLLPTEYLLFEGLSLLFIDVS